MVERFRIASYLSVSAGVINVVIGVILLAASPDANQLLPASTAVGAGELALIGGLNTLCGFAILLGGVFQRTGEAQRVKAGSILVLVFSGLTIFLTEGLVVGLLLGIVGGILGLTWKPLESQ